MRRFHHLDHQTGQPLFDRIIIFIFIIKWLFYDFNFLLPKKSSKLPHLFIVWANSSLWYLKNYYLWSNKLKYKISNYFVKIKKNREPRLNN